MPCLVYGETAGGFGCRHVSKQRWCLDQVVQLQLPVLSIRRPGERSRGVQSCEFAPVRVICRIQSEVQRSLNGSRASTRFESRRRGWMRQDALFRMPFDAFSFNHSLLQFMVIKSFTYMVSSSLCLANPRPRTSPAFRCKPDSLVCGARCGSSAACRHMQHPDLEA